MIRGIGAACIAVALAGCQEAPYVPDPNYLSADAHLRIAGTYFVVPIVSVGSVTGPKPYSFDWERLSEADKKQFRQATSNPAEPLSADSARLHFETYGSHGESNRSSAICPRLSRHWSRTLCEGRRPGLLRDLPRWGLTVAGDRVLSSLFVGYDKPNGGLALQNLQEGRPAFRWSKDYKSGLAAVRISPEIVAVWSVWNEPNESIEQMTGRQGKAITVFVQDSIGEHERVDRIEGR